MRLWSVHPKYLSDKDVLVCWRQGLLALAALRGRTKGYKNHPQLERFKKTSNPISYLKLYLGTIYQESVKRGYKFDMKKIGYLHINQDFKPIPISKGQIMFEFAYLQQHFRKTNPHRIEKLNIMRCSGKDLKNINPLFNVIPNENRESWETKETNIGTYLFEHIV